MRSSNPRNEFSSPDIYKIDSSRATLKSPLSDERTSPSSLSTSSIDIQRALEDESLYAGAYWKTQLDLFFEDAGHGECEHRNRIMRLLMEDAVQISQPEGDFEQKISETNQDLNFSPSAVQAMIMTEAKQMYLRYCSKHLGEADHAQKVYVFWKNKHYDYNYNDALERSSAKRSLITLFYQLEVSPYLLQGGSGPFHFDQEGTKALDSISDRIRSSDCCDDHDDNEMNLLSQRFSPPYYPTSPVDSHCCSFWDTNQDDILLSENVYQNDQDLDISRRAGSRPEKPNDVYHSKLISKHEIFTSDGEVSPHALTRNANKSTRKGPTSPPFIEHSAAKRVKSNKYEYRVISQNGMPIIEIID